MELVIAEKPSVARSIAQVIGATEHGEGFLKGNGYIVSWCYGHLIELATPETYDESLKKWTYDTLPILPAEWKYVVKKDTKDQFKVLKKLMKDNSVTAVICATDAGREGELIFRLVYEQAGCNKPIKRLWISSMEESAIREGFDHLRPGAEYDALYRSALCRQQADWIVGLNGTRLFTVLYRNKVLKVGRVQTPTLSMIVDREEAIRNFRKTSFYTVHLMESGLDAVSEKYQNECKARAVALTCNGKDAIVKSVVSEEKSIAAPHLYDLTTLQRDANRIFGLTAKKTLEYTQSLYEKKLCTYPRTDSMYLSDDMEETAKNVLVAVRKCFSYLSVDEKPANFGKIMDSRKVTDHHAIIPTVQIEKLNMADVSEGEMKILSLLATRVVMATAQKYRYMSINAEIDCVGVGYTASGKTVLNEGWKKYETALRDHFNVKAEKEDEESSKAIPALTEGMVIQSVETKVIEGFTKPPSRYTEDSLLAAMEKAGSEEMVDDVERKGLGTPATRADIIEKLVKDGFVKREKKQMIPTDDGVKLITVLPHVVKSPKLTADWENALTLVSKGEYDPKQFMDGIRNMVTDLVKTYHEVGEEDKNMFGSNDALGKCPKCGGDVFKGKYGIYCSEKCGMSFNKAYGKELTEEQVKDLLDGRKIYVEDLKSKKGGTFNAYLIPDGVQEYSYTKKDGSEFNGFQYKFNMEFPKKEDK